MVEEKDIKSNRILTIFEKLRLGQTVTRKGLASEFGVNEKTIQRDINDIRAYLSDKKYMGATSDVVYCRKRKGYLISNNDESIVSKEEALAITKVLLESRAFNKVEMTSLINKILNIVDYDNRKQIKELVSNELFNFVPLKHNKELLDVLWNLSNLIKQNEVIEITYIKANNKEVNRCIKPVGLMFSEYYFYLIGYFDDSRFNDPVIFRVDRIINYKSIERKFSIPYKDRFEEGEFRKRIQFMYNGDLIRLRFEFYGLSIDAILDRLPTARIIEKYEGKYVIEAEVFGNGIVMWLLSQGKLVKVISPNELVKEITSQINSIQELYKQ